MKKAVPQNKRNNNFLQRGGTGIRGVYGPSGLRGAPALALHNGAAQVLFSTIVWLSGVHGEKSGGECYGKMFSPIPCVPQPFETSTESKVVEVGILSCF